MPSSTSLTQLSGANSSLDVKSIVAGLVDAKKAPTTKKLESKEVSIQQQISAYGDLKNKLATFQSKLTALRTETTFQQRAVSVAQTTTGITVATATAETSAAVGSYDLEVTQLARAQNLSTTGGGSPFTRLSDVIGTGTLQIQFGTTIGAPGNAYSFTNDSSLATQTITVDSSNNTLESFRNYINAGNYGFTASTIYDGVHYTLALTASNTGTKNSLQINVTDTGDSNNTNNSGLSRLAFNLGSVDSSLTQNTSSLNASVKLNNITITPTSNTLVDAIPGVSLSFKNTTLLNTPVKINVTADNSAIESKVSDFVSAFNDLKTQINTYTAYNATSGEKGVFLGNSTATNIKRLLSNEISQVVPSLSGSYRALSDIGITTNIADGTLLFDSNLLNAAINSDANQVARVFGVTASATNNGVSYINSTSDTVAGTYAVSVNTLPAQGFVVCGDIAALNVTPNNDTFTIQVDGVTSGTITLTQGMYNSIAALTAEIQNKINADPALLAAGKSVSVTYGPADNFTITSANYGVLSRVAFVSVEGEYGHPLGFSTSLQSVSGVDVVGTINAAPATGTGQYLVSSSGNSKGLQLKITAAAPGSLGTVNFTRGKGDTFNTLINNLINSTGLIVRSTASANTQLTNIHAQRDTLNKQLAAYEARLTKQFNALDRQLAALKSQSSFLTQALAGLSSNRSSNKSN